VQVSTKWAINKRIHGVKESSGWGIYLWAPGEMDWWIPARYQHGNADAPAATPTATPAAAPAKVH